MAPSFTFLNTTDAPGLSKAGTRAMRAHVTKANFARRRERIMKDKFHGSKALGAVHRSNDTSTLQPVRHDVQSNDQTPLLIQPRDPQHMINFRKRVQFFSPPCDRLEAVTPSTPSVLVQWLIRTSLARVSSSHLPPRPDWESKRGGVDRVADPRTGSGRGDHGYFRQAPVAFW